MNIPFYPKIHLQDNLLVRIYYKILFQDKAPPDKNWHNQAATKAANFVVSYISFSVSPGYP